MSDGTSVDPASVLFRLEDEFTVLRVERVTAERVKVIIEQREREGRARSVG